MGHCTGPYLTSLGVHDVTESDGIFIEIIKDLQIHLQNVKWHGKHKTNTRVKIANVTKCNQYTYLLSKLKQLLLLWGPLLLAPSTTAAILYSF